VTPEVWRHIPSGGPFPWENGVDYTVEETAPNVFEYRYRACECPEEPAAVTSPRTPRR